MSFNPNIPTISDPILQSFGQLRANFQTINSAFGTNHVPLTEDPSISGMHANLTLRPESGDPVTTATETALYNKLVGGIPEVFFRPNSSQTPIQLTYPSIKADSTLTQYTFVAGPFVIYGGFINQPTNGQLVTLTPSTTLLSVDLTTANVDFTLLNVLYAIPTDITGNTFKIKFQINPISKFGVYYFAIGI